MAKDKINFDRVPDWTSKVGLAGVKYSLTRWIVSNMCGIIVFSSF